MSSDKNRLTVQEIFNSPIQYMVPSYYQRPYVWNRENQWNDLWDDIKRKTEEVLAQGKSADHPEDEIIEEVVEDTISNHFFGAFVVRAYEHRGLGPQKKDIIDGQQRLTSLQIILQAFRHAANTIVGANHRIVSELRLLLENPNCKPDENEIHKVVPTESDQELFKRIMGAADHNSLKSLSVKSKSGEESTQTERGIDGAYFFFYQAIFDFMHENEVERKVEKLYEVVAQRMHLVMIELLHTDDPQVIFEALNGRGTPLLPSDLIKNHVFERARITAKIKNPMQLYEKYWSFFDIECEESDLEEKNGSGVEKRDDENIQPEKFWKKEIQQGRLLRPRIDLFLFHYLQYRNNKPVVITELFREFKKWWKNECNDNKENLETNLGEIDKHAKYFKRIIVLNEKVKPLNDHLKNLVAIDTGTIYPLLLFLFSESEKPSGKVKFKDLPDLIWSLESYLVRRAICGLTTKNYNNLFLKTLAALKELQSIDANTIGKLLADEKAETNYFPKDDLFKHNWISRPIYTSGASGFIKMMLSVINEEMKKKGEEPSTFRYDGLWVEHVMPQKWEAYWPLAKPDDEHHKDSNTKISITNRQWRGLTIHTMGNLTLLTQQLNKDISNGPYNDPAKTTDKYREIRDRSRLRINDYFEKRTTWDEETIKNRSEDLFGYAVKNWPYPAA